MTQPIPAEFWDARYSEDGFAYGDRPSRLLMGWSDTISDQGGHALVPACGEGRDAVYLARLGLDVTAVDMSAAGLDKAEQLAERHGVSVTPVKADLLAWDWPTGEMDVVAAMFAHMPSHVRGEFHARMAAALKPGGYVFVEGFTKAQSQYQMRYKSGGPPDPDMLYAETDLPDYFGDLEQLALWTGVETLTEGPYHTGPAAMLRAAYRKPE